MPEEVEEGEEGAPEWITTFADLMSLLLTFFILMLSFSSMKAEKLKEMVTSIRKAMGSTQNQFSDIPIDVDIPAIVERSAKIPGTPGVISDITEKMKSFAAANGFASKFSIDKNNRGTVMRINNSLLFRAGGMKLKKEALPLLDEMARVIRNKPFFISVEGHTDDSPIKTERFPSNWELGADRAGSIARYLIGEGHMSPKRFQVISYGSSLPMEKGNTVEDRARNRRVEITLTREK